MARFDEPDFPTPAERCFYEETPVSDPVILDSVWGAEPEGSEVLDSVPDEWKDDCEDF